MNNLHQILYRQATAFLSLSRWLRLGVVVFMISGALDLFYHGISAYWPGSLDAFFGPDGYYVHRALFFGMVFITIGVIRTRPNPNHAVPHPTGSTGGDFAKNEFKGRFLSR